MVNFSTFVKSKNIFRFLFFFLVNILARYRIPGWQFLFHSVFTLLLHYVLACFVSREKSSVSLIFLCTIIFYPLWLLRFSIFSLLLVLSNSIMMYLGVAFFMYLVIEVDLVVCIYGLIISIKFGKFLPIFLSFPPLWEDTSSSLMLWSFLFSLFCVFYFEWLLLLSYIPYIFLLQSSLL